MDGVTITGLEIENVKRVRAVVLDADTLRPNGLCLIGGDNGQGKTTILDAICGALGGDEFRQPVRDGAERGTVRVTLSNGIVAERIYTSGGSSRLKVEDPSGRKGGQALLNDFVSPFALNVGEFMLASDKEKAKILLKVIGVNPQPYEERIRTLEADRLIKGRERDRAKGHAESLPYFEDAGLEKLDGNAISGQMTEALRHNARIRQASGDVQAAREREEFTAMKEAQAEQAVSDAIAARDRARQARQAAAQAVQDAIEQAATAGQPVDTQAVSAKLQQVTEHNERVGGNLARKHAFEMHEQLAEEYRAIQDEIDRTREELRATLEGAALPYPGLLVDDGELTYHGRRWATLSESERLILATAVSRAVKPGCKFVLIDGMERMDGKTRAAFAGWLATQGLQGIGTTVGDGADCSLIIEDGVVAGHPQQADDESFV